MISRWSKMSLRSSPNFWIVKTSLTLSCFQNLTNLFALFSITLREKKKEKKIDG